MSSESTSGIILLSDYLRCVAKVALDRAKRPPARSIRAKISKMSCRRHVWASIVSLSAQPVACPSIHTLT